MKIKSFALFLKQSKLIIMTFDEFENIALDAYDSLPDAVKENLNLGIAVVPEEKKCKDGITCTLGEYFVNPMMGRGIKIYYGSFMAVMGDAPEPMLRHEIMKTVKHELRHHVEISSGVDYLGVEDKIKMAEIRERLGMNPDEKQVIRNVVRNLLNAVIILAVVLIVIYILVLRHV